MEKEIERLLEKDLSLIRAADKNGFTALHYAVRGDAKEACQLLIDKGTYIEAKTDKKEDLQHLCTSLQCELTVPNAIL
ncbi:MAG: hypothetical protein A2Y62_03635 [Candidatus Fischerbacteria bacterium RBG_13_37_8]|uniref:Ankyrin repeat protein n=1 Tax=Candidatus Fischerbacteria bacterium RBG_13_37_8 TaxID=1817863 RepID=A0A1F5V805_9BACT|nr:MAG: hypothetical protein A2Y62_03635 [Candidatus Fischerbacteria bacterium RBG_13_37_8]